MKEDGAGTPDEHPILGPLATLIDRWCEDRRLGALAVVLPSYVSNFGQTDDWGAIMDALRTLRANRKMPDDERREVERILVLVERVVFR